MKKLKRFTLRKIKNVNSIEDSFDDIILSPSPFPFQSEYMKSLEMVQMETKSKTDIEKKPSNDAPSQSINPETSNSPSQSFSLAQNFVQTIAKTEEIEEIEEIEENLPPFHIFLFPDEILENIFYFCQEGDLHSARFVCRRFRNLIYTFPIPLLLPHQSLSSSPLEFFQTSIKDYRKPIWKQWIPYRELVRYFCASCPRLKISVFGIFPLDKPSEDIDIQFFYDLDESVKEQIINAFVNTIYILPAERNFVLTFLGNCNLQKYSRAIAALFHVFENDRNFENSFLAISSLGKQNLSQYTPIIKSFIILLSQDQLDRFLKQKLIEALGNQDLSSYPECLKLITNSLKEGMSIRNIATFALGNQNLEVFPPSIDSIIYCLGNDSFWEVRRNAAWALGNQNLSLFYYAVGALINCLNYDPSWWVRKEIIDALNKQTTFGNVKEETKKLWKSQLKEASLNQINHDLKENIELLLTKLQ